MNTTKYEKALELLASRDSNCNKRGFEAIKNSECPTQWVAFCYAIGLGVKRNREAALKAADHFDSYWGLTNKRHKHAYLHREIASLTRVLTWYDLYDPIQYEETVKQVKEAAFKGALNNSQ